MSLCGSWIPPITVRCPRSFRLNSARLADQVTLSWTTSQSGLSYILAILRQDAVTFSSSISTPVDAINSTLGFSQTAGQRNVLVEIFSFNPSTSRISIRCALNITSLPSLAAYPVAVTFPPTIDPRGVTTIPGTTTPMVNFAMAANVGYTRYIITNTSTDCRRDGQVQLRTNTYSPGATDFVTNNCGSHELCVYGNTTTVVSDQRCSRIYGSDLREVSNVCGVAGRNVAPIRKFEVFSSANTVTMTWTAVALQVSDLYGGWELKIYTYDLISGTWGFYVSKGTTQVLTLPSSKFLLFIRAYVHAIGCDAYSIATRAVAAGTSASVTNTGSSLRLSYIPAGSTTVVVQQVENATTVVATRSLLGTTARKSSKLPTTNKPQDLIAQDTHLRALNAPVNSVQYLGCYGNDEKGFPLVVPFVVKGPMTFERCRTEALRSNLKYFGLTVSICFLGDIAPTISYPDANCNLSCPGNSSQTCGGTSPVVHSLYALHDFYYQSVVSYTYSNSPSATVGNSLKAGDAAYTPNSVRLISGANKFGALKIAPPSFGARSFAAIFHGFSFPPSPSSGFGLSFNYGPSSRYSSSFTYDNVFTSGSPGLSILLVMTNPIQFMVKLNGVVIENTMNWDNPLSFLDLVTGVPIRFTFHVSEKTWGDPRLHLVINSDYYALSNISLGDAYVPDVTWAFRFVASSGAAPQNFFVHNVKLWSKKPEGRPMQVAGKYTYQGCYLDQDFNPISVVYNTDAQMTISLCHDNALQGLFEYFGLTMGNQCFLGRGKPSRPSIMCTHACLNAGSELCGGFSSFSLYSVDDLPVPDSKVSFMLGQGTESVILSLDNYFRDADAPTTTYATLTVPFGSSSGSILFPGPTPASTAFVAILHLIAAPPSTIPASGVTVGLSLRYAEVNVVCSPTCVPTAVGGLQVTLTYDAGAQWTAKIRYLGSIIATAPLDPVQFASSTVISYVELTVSVEATSADPLLKLKVGNVASTSTVFSKVVVPSTFVPLTTWSFLLEGNSVAASVFSPKIYSFLAFSISGFPEYPIGWTTLPSDSSELDYLYRYVTYPPAGASSVVIPLAGSQDMGIYALRFNSVGDLIVADALNYAPVPAPSGLTTNVTSCSSVTISWSPVDLDGVVYIVTLKNKSTGSVVDTVSTTATTVVHRVVGKVTYEVEVKTSWFDNTTSKVVNSTRNPKDTFDIIGQPYLISVKYDRQYVGSPTLPSATVVWTTLLPADTYGWTLYSATSSPVSSFGPVFASGDAYTAVIDIPERNVQYFVVVTNSFVCGSSTFNIESSPFPIMIVDLSEQAAAEGDLRNIVVTQLSATSLQGSWDPVIGYDGLTPLYRICTSVVGCSPLSPETTQKVTKLRPGLSLEYWVELYLNETNQLIKRSDATLYNTVDINVSNASITFLNDTTARICWLASSQLTADIKFRILIEFLSARIDEGPTDPILVKNISRLDTCQDVRLPILAELQVSISSHYQYDTIFPDFKSQPAIAYHYLPSGVVTAVKRINRYTATVKWTYTPVPPLSYSQVIEVYNTKLFNTTTYPVTSGTSELTINYLEGVEYNIALVTTYLDFSAVVVRPSRPILYYEAFCMCTLGDPHIETWDHLTMTVAMTGDVVLAQSLKTGLAFHGRFCLLGSQAAGSWICGMSLRCGHGHDSVQLFSHQIEGHVGPLFVGNSMLRPTIRSEASYTRHGVHHQELTFTCPGEEVRVQIHKFSCLNHLHMCMKVDPSYAKANHITGLAGVPNNDRTDDLIRRDGTKVPLPNHLKTGTIYHAVEDVARDWRIGKNDSVFLRPFPKDDLSAPTLHSDSEVEAFRLRDSDSEDGCAAAGLAEPYLTMCRFDLHQVPHLHVPMKYNVTQHSRHHSRW